MLGARHDRVQSMHDAQRPAAYPADEADAPVCYCDLDDPSIPEDAVCPACNARLARWSVGGRVSAPFPLS